MSADTLLLSPEEALAAARAHAALPSSPTEREFDPRRLAHLVHRLRSRWWLPCQWATVRFEGVKYRMNGQHSSAALLEAPDALPGEVAIHLDHFEAPDGVGMGILFRQFDARLSARSPHDVCGAYQGLVSELRGLSRKKAKIGIEGVAWYERVREGLPTPPGDELYSKLLVPAYHPFLRWLDRVLVHGKTREMERAPVVGTMYWTFLASESGAQEFWSHVAKNDLSDDSDPRSVLSRELTEASDPEKQKEREKLSPVEFHAKCVKAWNAFRAGDKIRSLNVNVRKGLPELAA